MGYAFSNRAVFRVGRKAFAAALLGTTAFAVLLPATTGPATAQSAQISFNIPAGPLSQAITAYGRQAGLQVTFLASTAAGKTTAGFSGTATREGALSRLLSGTGLSYSFTAANTVAISTVPAAEGTADAAGSVVLDTIDVTAQGVGDAPFRTPAAVSTTTAANLQGRYGGDVNQALRNTPGTFSRPGGNQPGLSVNIRGMSGYGRVNSMIDGVPQTFRNGAGHGAYGGTYLYLQPDFIAGVDITRGAVSGAAGSGTLSGAANFRSIGIDDILLPSSNAGVMTKWKVGSNGYDWSGMTAAGMRTAINGGEGEMSVMGAWADSQSKDYRNGDGTTFYERNRPLGGLGKIEIKPNDTHALKLGWVYYDNDFRNSGYMWGVKNNTYSLNYAFTPDSNLFDTKINLYYNKANMLYDPGAGGGSYAGRETDAISFGGDITNTSTFDLTKGFGLKLDYGVSYHMDDYRVSERRGVNQPGKLAKASAFTDATLSYGMFDFITGLRYDHWHLSGTRQARTQGTGAGGSAECPVGPENCPAEHVSRDGGKVNPKFTLAANPTNWLQLYTTYSHTYRPPTAQESFWGLVGIGAQLGSGIYNNMDLEPETSKGWDLGFNIAKNDLFFEKDTARLKVGYFDNRIKNYITNGTISMERCAGAAECWYDTAMWINVPGTTRMRGVEIEGGYDAGFAYANFSYTNATTKTPAGGMVGSGGNADIDILPKYYGMVDVGMRFFDEKLALGGKARFVGKGTYATISFTTPEATLTDVPSYTLFDIYGSYDFNEASRLFFSVENVANKVYAVPLSGDGVQLAGKGRTFIAGFSTKIGVPGMSSKPADPDAGIMAAIAAQKGGMIAPASYDWSGFYAGVSAGHDWSRNGNDYALDASGVSYTSSYRQRLEGFLGGVYAGYNHDFGNGFVAGVDADLNIADSSGGPDTFSVYRANASDYLNATLKSKQSWSGALRGRIGYAYGRYLPYVAAGVAVAGYEHEASFANGWLATARDPVSGSKTHTGFTIGTGIEHAVTDKAIVRAEYRYSDYGSADFSAAGLDRKVTIDSSHDLRFGLSYKF